MMIKLKNLFRALAAEDRVNVLIVDDSLNENIYRRTSGYELRKEAILKSPTVMLNLIKRVVDCSIPASIERNGYSRIGLSH